MPVLINNLQWMAWNVFLAIIPIPFCYLTVKYGRQFISSIFFVFWILFFPNTIYLITDIEYLPHQLSRTVISYDTLLILEYLILVGLGVITYLWALKPISSKFKTPQYIVYIFNFGVAFAVALGKIQRTESWQVITNPIRVINDVGKSLSNGQIILFVILFGILINFIWILGTMRHDSHS